MNSRTIGNVQYQPHSPVADSPEWANHERVILRHTEDGPVTEVLQPGEMVAGWVIGSVLKAEHIPAKWITTPGRVETPIEALTQIAPDVEAEPMNNRPKNNTPARNRPTFAVAIKNFLKAAQAKVDEHWRESGQQGPNPHLTFVAGHLYIKVVRSEGDQEYAHCFINPRTGDILKSLSWKKIAPGVRGNIFDPDFGASGVDWSGAVRFR